MSKSKQGLLHEIHKLEEEYLKLQLNLYREHCERALNSELRKIDPNISFKFVPHNYRKEIRLAQKKANEAVK